MRKSQTKVPRTSTLAGARSDLVGRYVIERP